MPHNLIKIGFLPVVFGLVLANTHKLLYGWYLDTSVNPTIQKL